LQALLALLHADCPLQEFTPEQCTLASSALAVLIAAVENITAAAAAKATLGSILELIRSLLIRDGGTPRIVRLGCVK
jgi:hypothetical protein